MQELFSLGKMYVSDFLRPGEEPRHEPVELKLMMDEYGRVRLEKSAPRETMWGAYWYRSGINSSMRQHLYDGYCSITGVFKTNPGAVWCDIACNDGTLLSFVPERIYTIGIDPADDSYKEEAIKYSDIHIQDYFSVQQTLV